VPIYNEYLSKLNEVNIKFNIVSNAKSGIVRADKYSVYHIFNQIVDNAVKYTEKGAISISLNNAENNKLEISVSDTGIGISEEYFPIIFMPFTQEEQGYTRRFEGNGLGLALVKKYCDLNHAEIKITSKKEIGTTVTVLF
jgi:signal transduction histidine kinase